MTDKEIGKLTRKELIEMLLSATTENDRLREEIEKLNKELRIRKIAVENSGTMAEAALKLNRVFEAADAAAKQYLQNVKAKADAEARASSEETCEAEAEKAEKTEETAEEKPEEEPHGD
ncbi:MAG: DNA repair protein [Clostridia bacterium]|nr:DNA repair protein [Clostridia bacterium]